MRIAFFASNCVPFHAKSLEERPLGGTETGVIRMAECLTALGHDVTVFTPMPNPPASKPTYLPLAAVEQHPGVDVFISIRDWIPCMYRIPASKRMMWTGDSYDQFCNFGLGDKRVAEVVDNLLTVSPWQADQLCERSGYPRSKAWVIENGIELDHFKGSEPRARKRLIYSSTPHRGLSFVPALMMKLREKHPEAEIHIYSSYKVYHDERANERPDFFSVLEKTPGCILHESILQKDLAREFMKSSVLFYPCDFEETFCITAMEAQAAGCVTLASELAALPTTVGQSGILIPGRPSRPGYAEEFVNACDRLLSDDGLWTRLSEEGKRRAQGYSWTNLAKRFHDFLSPQVAQSPRADASQPRFN